MENETTPSDPIGVNVKKVVTPEGATVKVASSNGVYVKMLVEISTSASQPKIITKVRDHAYLHVEVRGEEDGRARVVVLEWKRFYEANPSWEFEVRRWDYTNHPFAQKKGWKAVRTSNWYFRDENVVPGKYFYTVRGIPKKPTLK